MLGMKINVGFNPDERQRVAVWVIGMAILACSDCYKVLFTENDRKHGVCFKCRIGSVSLGFTYGKEEFHGPTINERKAEQEAGYRAAGIDFEPVPLRKELI